MHADTPTPELTDLERQVLDFAGRMWRYDGRQEAEIRGRFDMTGTRYWQLVNGLIDTAAAQAYAPGLVKRLRSLRAVRAHARSARGLPATG